MIDDNEATEMERSAIRGLSRYRKTDRAAFDRSVDVLVLLEDRRCILRCAEAELK